MRYSEWEISSHSADFGRHKFCGPLYESMKYAVTWTVTEYLTWQKSILGLPD